MIEGLMHICQRWGKQVCHPEVADLKLPKEVEPGKPILLWPCGAELRRIDEICKGCKEYAFTIKEPNCPVCETYHLETGEYLKSLKFGPVTPSREVFLYKCKDCGRYLTSHLKFF
jgi:predicted amidophosphoribosyltransferase